MIVRADARVESQLRQPRPGKINELQLPLRRDGRGSTDGQRVYAHRFRRNVTERFDERSVEMFRRIENTITTSCSIEPVVSGAPPERWIVLQPMDTDERLIGLERRQI